MPLLRVNALGSTPVAGDGSGVESLLASQLGLLPFGAGVLIMIHGFKFSPFTDLYSPHRHILSLTPETVDRKAVSWPRHLGYSGRRPDEGLCIAFGWHGCGSIWQAYRRAARAGHALSRLVQRIKALRPDLKIDLIAHSLGARVALAALPRLDADALRRVILMSPAELNSAAERMLATPAGRTAEFLAIASRENDLFDFLFERAIAPFAPTDRSLGHRMPDCTNWVTLEIDHPATLQALRARRIKVAAPALRICHWSPYLRPGMFGLYRKFLAGQIGLEGLRACQPQQRHPRWSRLLAGPQEFAS